MSTTHKPVRILGIVGLVAGLAMIVIGGATWGVVSAQLDDQRITVAADASFMAGTAVNNPLSAFAQAQVIDKHTLDITGGKTFAELDREDPLRATAQQGAFLRASLFTSVIAYGVAALVMGLGVLVAGNGYALTRIAAGAKVAQPTPVTV
ncbi:aromatic ring-opening dioxygenase LigA [Xylanimonas allomyrinae]|uniref:Aromatic ring-opening dioxygenase LigA n=1 Tax=Xylanimonas allomyrinae TaxID=2509459 RepID=A0A4P6EN70_9MICO|nr:aromatic ring-opening dioxygenase LigA [Xylanimonas allomyrinae]QAY62759.1 aromatic ring-opening dioxygenase LigA [Xylanimonas allomyrinae]